jgi:hypothetical protein
VAAAERVTRASRVGQVVRDALAGGARRRPHAKGEDAVVLDALYQQWMV